MASQKTEWTNLSEVQLKGALVRRGLDTTGTKEELIKRLQDHEEGKAAKKAEGGEAEEEIVPVLVKQRMTFGFYLSLSLKSVIITPFRLNMLSDTGVANLIEEAMSYNLKKTKNGDSAMLIRYPTAMKGDAALVDLKTKFEELKDVKVYHPWKDNVSSGGDNSFDSIVKEIPSGHLFERCVVLENLPESLNTEEKLCELFPEAADVVSYQFDPASKGIAILDFLNQEEADQFLKNTGEEVELEGEKIAVANYYNRFFRAYDRVEVRKDPPVWSDEERIKKTAEVKAVADEMKDLQNSREITGQDKFLKFVELDKKFRELRREHNAETSRRIKAEEFEMPEGEENMLESTKSFISRAKAKAAEKKEGASSTDRSKATKRVSETSRKTSSDSTRTSFSTRGRGKILRGARSSLNGTTRSSLAARSTFARGTRRGSGVTRLTQKRPVGRSNYGDSYDFPPAKRHSLGSGRSERDESQSSIKMIEGLTSVLTDKMRTLEHLQQQTLKTQAELMKTSSMGSSLSGMDSMDRHHYDRAGYTSGAGSGSYGSMSVSGSYGSGAGGGYSGSSGYGGSSAGGYSGSSGGYGGGSSSLGGGSSGGYYASPPSRRLSGGGGGYKKRAGRNKRK